MKRFKNSIKPLWRREIRRRDVKYTRRDKGDGNRQFVALNETNFYFEIQISIHLSWNGEGESVGGFEDLSRVYQAIKDTEKLILKEILGIMLKNSNTYFSNKVL